LTFFSFLQFIIPPSIPMGGAVLSQYLQDKGLSNSIAAKEYEFYAFKVIDFDWNHGAIYHDRSDNTESVSANEQQIYIRMEEIRRNAFLEKDLSLLECRCPEVIHYKYSNLSEQERKSFNNSMLELIVEKDKSKKSTSKPSSTAADYSKSFGGTADDTKNEKEAAEILRGSATNNDNPSGSGSNSFLGDLFIYPVCKYHSQSVMLKKNGKWLRFLSVSAGCYMYFHNLTKELISIRPEDYEDEVVELVEDKKEEIDVSNGLPKIPFSQLPAEIERIVKEEQKTPLIIDTSPNDVARTFFTYKACLEDASCLTIPFGKSGLKKEEIMERCRKKLVSAMKTGKLFVLYLGGVSIEHADFKTKLCKKVSSSFLLFFYFATIVLFLFCCFLLFVGCLP
jgi:hypothetical protein